MAKLSVNHAIISIIGNIPGFFTVGPFMTTSECLAPIYPDLRKMFSDPNSLKAIAHEVVKLIKKEKIKFDFILGGATAGIPIATAVALEIKKPFGYVRSKAKAGGLGRAVEGNWQPEMKALLIDDAAAHGVGKIKFIRNIRRTGMKIDTVITIISRNRKNFKDRAWIKKMKVKFYDFGDLLDIMNYCLKNKLVTKEAADLFTWFAQDPHNWQKDKEKWAYFEKYKRLRKRDSKLGI